MRGADQRLKEMAQSNRKKHCGKCGDGGHSIRTCQEMKAVSAARLKEVLEHGKAKSSDTQRLPASEFGLSKQRKCPMEDRTHQIKPPTSRAGLMIAGVRSYGGENL